LVDQDNPHRHQGRRTQKGKAQHLAKQKMAQQNRQNRGQERKRGDGGGRINRQKPHPCHKAARDDHARLYHQPHPIHRRDIADQGPKQRRDGQKNRGRDDHHPEQLRLWPRIFQPRGARNKRRARPAQGPHQRAGVAQPTDLPRIRPPTRGDGPSRAQERQRQPCGFHRRGAFTGDEKMRQNAHPDRHGIHDQGRVADGGEVKGNE